MTRIRKEIPRWAVCTCCCERWAQSNSGLCRRCDRLRLADVIVAPTEVAPTVPHERLHVVRRPERATALLSRHYERPDPTEPRPEHLVDGVVYVVVWSGVDAGGEALGIPPAGLRGTLAFNPSRLERYSYA